MIEPHKEELALLYVRVSTAMQVEDGISLEVQERSLIKASEEAGYKKYEVIREEGRSGKNLSGRPAISSALERLKNHQASALFVTRIDRLARSTRDFLAIVDQSQEFNWRLVLLDLNLDTSSYSSRFVVTIMSALAEMERGIIAERQKDVHKDRRARGIKWGVDMGPKNKTPEDIRQRVVDERSRGYSYRKIADGLNRDAISSQNGGKWYPTTVKNLLETISQQQ